MNDVDYGVQSAASLALCASNAPQAADMRLALLENNVNLLISNAIMTAITAHKDRRIVDLLLASIADLPYDHPIIGFELKALGILGDPRAYHSLQKFLQSDHMELHTTAAEALGMLKDARAVPALIAALAENSFPQHGYTGWGNGIMHADLRECTREKAAWALGEIGDARAVEPLIAVLGWGPMFSRGAVAAALGKLKDKRAIAPLITALPQLTGDARTAAAAALKNITGVDLGADAEKWQQWLKKSTS